jgi:hypothetical protein
MRLCSEFFRRLLFLRFCLFEVLVDGGGVCGGGGGRGEGGGSKQKWSVNVAAGNLVL